MVFLLRLFFALLIAGQALLRWPHWNPRYSRKFAERRQEPLPFAAKLIRVEVVQAGRLRPLQVEGVELPARNERGDLERGREPVYRAADPGGWAVQALGNTALVVPSSIIT